jgi:signal transduction histidine kinase
VLAVLACVRVPRTNAPLYMALGLMLPMAIGFAASPPALPTWVVAANRVLGATVIWLSALVVWRNARLTRDRERTLGQLKQLHGAAERAANAERIELSRWLHEGLAQELAAVGWGLDRLARHTRGWKDVQAEARELRTVIDSALRTVHGRAVELRETDNEPGGLAALVERYVAAFIGRTGLSVGMTGANCLTAVPATHAALCFKIVQEALTNVGKHACASRVRVEFRQTSGVVHTVITDDGCGINAAARLKPDSLGLLGLHERLAAVGGALNVSNVEPHGVRLEAQVPIA